MTSNLILYGYYYRGKSQRQVIKALIVGSSSGSDITNAKTKLDEVIAEHDNYISSRGIANDGNTFTSIDNLSLHHSKDHLDRFLDGAQTQTKQKEKAISALSPQNDGAP